jgi:hypothetical protein
MFNSNVQANPFKQFAKPTRRADVQLNIQPNRSGSLSESYFLAAIIPWVFYNRNKPTSFNNNLLT